MGIWAVSLLNLDLSAQVLTPSHLQLPGIRSLVRIPGLPHDILSSALPPGEMREASPKAISGRTSYSRARLAFHFLPQVIPEFCTTHGFGPQWKISFHIILPMASSLGFGSYIFPSRSFQARFHFASGGFTSLDLGKI